MRAPFNAPSSKAPSCDVDGAGPSETEDIYLRLDRLQQSNAVLTAPIQAPVVRRVRVPISTPISMSAPMSSSASAAAGPSQGPFVFLPPVSRPPVTHVTRKRKLDDTSLPTNVKRRRS
ncbi:hypothetical protein B0H13DRAFT_1911152 [Mycena leptocephala]|nr:hypothetical protein B0H13DRAFT_1911152 [Mycena leptocephala]